jgi:hypothetical protein
VTRNARVDALGAQAAYLEELERRVRSLEQRSTPQLVARFPAAAGNPVTPPAGSYGGSLGATAVAATGNLDFTFRPNRKYWVSIFARAITSNASTVNSGALGLFDNTTVVVIGGQFMVPIGNSAEHIQAWGNWFVDGPTSGDGARYTQLHWRVGTKLATNVYVDYTLNMAGIWDLGPLIG